MTRSQTAVSLLFAAALALGARAATEEKPAAPAAPKKHMMTPADLAWMEAPPGLPPGAKMAVVDGDPGAEGPFTLRAKMPANYKVPAHWHPTQENVTIISGTLHMGMGDKLDEAKGTALGPGSFAAMPARTNHFAWTKGETVIQVHGLGPFAITYVNPADDPRTKAPVSARK